MYDGKNLPCIKEEAQTIRKRGQLSLWCYYGKENRQNYFIKIPQWIFFTLLQMYKKIQIHINTSCNIKFTDKYPICCQM